MMDLNREDEETKGWLNALHIIRPDGLNLYAEEVVQAEDEVRFGKPPAMRRSPFENR